MSRIRIQVSGLADVGDDEARGDGVSGSLVTLTSIDTATTHLIRIANTTDPSPPTLSLSTPPNVWTCTPNNGPHSYTFECITDLGLSTESTTRRVYSIASTNLGLRYPSPNERADPTGSLQNNGAAVIAACDFNEGGTNYLGWQPALQDWLEAIDTLDGTVGALALNDLTDVSTSGVAQGNVLYRNASQWVVLAPGTAGQVLTTAGAGANPTWASPSASGTLDNAYDSGGAGAGRQIHVDTGAVLLTREDLTGTTYTLDVALAASAFTGRPHGIHVDWTAAVSVTNASDVYGLHLEGATNAGAGESHAIQIDSGWDVGIQAFAPVICGDPGTEDGGIDINGTTYDAELKVSDIGGADPAQLVLHRHSTTQAATIIGARSNSDTSGHAAITAGQTLFDLHAAGWTGSHYDFAASISLDVDSSGTISGTSMPGRIVLSTTPSGSQTPTARLTIGNAGDWLVGGSPDAGLSGQPLVSQGPGSPPEWLPSTAVLPFDLDDNASTTILTETAGGGAGAYMVVDLTNGSEVITIGNATTNPDVTIAGTGTLTVDQNIAFTQASFNIGGGSHGTLGTNCVAVGYNAAAAGAFGVAMGYGAASSSNGAAFGYSASATSNAVAIGYLAAVSASAGVSIGSASDAAGDAVALGFGAQATSATSMAYGRNAAVTAGNQVAWGATSYSYHNWFGPQGPSGVVAPNTWTIQGTPGLTSSGGAPITLRAGDSAGGNQAGSALALYSGASTGSGAGGPIVLRTTLAGGSGSTVRTHSDRVRIDPTEGSYNTAAEGDGGWHFATGEYTQSTATTLEDAWTFPGSIPADHSIFLRATVTASYSDAGTPICAAYGVDAHAIVDGGTASINDTTNTYSNTTVINWDCQFSVTGGVPVLQVQSPVSTSTLWTFKIEWVIATTP